MSSIEHSRDWLGTFGEWGLTKRKHGELCDELSDHLSEMARVESHGAAQGAKDTLSQPTVRRKLAGVHLADQVYATLNRLPDKQEWRELAWLGVWFVLILLGDWLALYAEDFRANEPYSYQGIVSSDVAIGIATSAWLVQAVSRAGFFASFVLCLFNAWKIGWGVLLARVLQLKLIHTVLVVISFLLLGRALWESYPSTTGLLTNWPTWLYAPTISIAILAISLLTLLISNRRHWVFSFALAMMAVLLYVGGPATTVKLQISRPLAFDYTEGPDGYSTRTPSKDPELIAERAAKWANSQMEGVLIDVGSNNLKFMANLVVYMPGHMAPFEGDMWGGPTSENSWLNRKYTSVEPVSDALLSPVTWAGAGMGWLAAPIPLLGIIGLFTMVLLMGRRGIIEFAAYGIICGLGIASTVMPFLVGQQLSEMVMFNAEGIFHSPFPGFENLMINPEFHDPLWWTLVGGLVLSAGTPWLLTSLFLKPGQTEQQIDDGDKMQEAG